MADAAERQSMLIQQLRGVKAMQVGAGLVVDIDERHRLRLSLVVDEQKLIHEF